VARSEARIFTTIWQDVQFLALSEGAQRLFFFLLSQPDLSHCGLIALRERRWARSAAGLTPDRVSAALKELDAARFIVLDEETEEVLVRSLIRRDGIWKQPNVMKSAREAAQLIESRHVGLALLEELERIPAEDGSELARKVLTEFMEELANSLANPSGNPFDDPSRRGPGDGDPSRNPSQMGSGKGSGKGFDREAATESHDGVSQGEQTGGNPSGNPSAKGSADPSPSPSQGKGEGYGGQGVASPIPGIPSPPPPSAGTAAPGHDNEVTARTIVGEWIDRCAKRPPGQVIGQIAKHVKTLLDEGIDPDDVRRGLAEWMTRNVHPSVLPSLVNAVMNTIPARRDAPPRQTRSTTDERVAAAQSLKERFRTGAPPTIQGEIAR